MCVQFVTSRPPSPLSKTEAAPASQEPSSIVSILEEKANGM